VVGHVAEHIIVDIAEEMYVWLDAPIPVDIFQRGMVREETGVPAAHLVVGYLVCVLYAVFGEDVCRLNVQIGVYPWWCGPVFFGDCGKGDLRIGFRADTAFESFGEGLVVQEGPRVVEFVVEGAFEVAHGLDQLIELGITNEGEEGGAEAVGGGIIWGVIIAIEAVERTRRFVNYWWEKCG
jgi:hypothetical protein